MTQGTKRARCLRGSHTQISARRLALSCFNLKDLARLENSPALPSPLLFTQHCGPLAGSHRPLFVCSPLFSIYCLLRSLLPAPCLPCRLFTLKPGEEPRAVRKPPWKLLDPEPGGCLDSESPSLFLVSVKRKSCLLSRADASGITARAVCARGWGGRSRPWGWGREEGGDILKTFMRPCNSQEVFATHQERSAVRFLHPQNWVILEVRQATAAGRERC